LMTIWWSLKLLEREGLLFLPSVSKVAFIFNPLKPEVLVVFYYDIVIAFKDILFEVDFLDSVTTYDFDVD
jgi:hypothetical protein